MNHYHGQLSSPPGGGGCSVLLLPFSETGKYSVLLSFNFEVAAMTQARTFFVTLFSLHTYTEL
jgi:hypothetical protein